MSFSEVFKKWNDPSAYFEVYTSGSTGAPKLIRLEKKKMEVSAKMSLKYFELRPGQRVLLALPTDKIGGIMLCVRAIIGQLEVVEVKPRLNPLLEEIPEVQFCSLTPAQLASVLSNENSRNQVVKIEKVLLGGSAVHHSLITQIQRLPNQVFHSYGMTETISHVAVRNLSSDDHFFQALEGVDFDTNENGQLIIHAPNLLDQDLLTNDVVELDGSKKMMWRGRIDNVVNSGGVKLLIEEVEQKIRGHFEGQFYLTKEEDEILGERLIMISKVPVDKNAFKDLQKFEVPKRVVLVNSFRYTENGKLLRLSPQQLMGL